ncbi:MAG: M23 family metallopeptidase, partial [Bacteroidetes bacterium]|nr:M23 family metallopeptidase [Bacteroidota bacterium]
YSGQTGTGAPHLHFERRRNDTPLNPLTHGFSIPDKTRPVFQRIGFKMTDDHSVFVNGRRKMFLDVSAGEKGAYKLDTVLYFNRPFGLLADCFDRMRPDGMRQAAYRLSLYIDGKMQYQSVFDSVSFYTGDAVSLEYDYLEAVDKRKFVRRLFDEYGNTFAGSGPIDDRRGIFGLVDEVPGMHEARIEAEDAFGNKSQLTFKFVWGPRDQFIYVRDSLVRGTADTNFFYLSPRGDVKPYDLDSADVFLNRGTQWGRAIGATTTLHDDGLVTVQVVGNLTTGTTLRLNLYPSIGGVIEDNIFNGLNERGNAKPRLVHEIVEDGLLVQFDCQAVKSSRSRLELYHGDTLLGIETPEFLNMGNYICFVPPKPQYRRIDQLKAVFSEDTSWTAGFFDSVNIVLVGHDQNEMIPFDAHATLSFSRDAFYSPQFVELQTVPLANPALLGLNSHTYRILPGAFVTRKPFDVIYNFPLKTTEANAKSGLCWLNEDKNKWVWLDNTFSNDTLTAGSVGGGYFAAVFDYEAPRIANLSIRDGYTYQNVRPAINFVIEDSLSGIGDDRDIIIELDGEWLIPEYEPETGMVRSKPLEPLKPGRHHLGIQVTDRVGNKTEQYLNFIVKLSGKAH